MEYLTHQTTQQQQQFSQYDFSFADSLFCYLGMEKMSTSITSKAQK